MPMGHAHPQPLAFAASTMGARHVGGRPGLVDKDQPVRMKVELVVEPGLPQFQDIAVLLDGVRSLFLRVKLRRAKKRWSVEIATAMPCAANP